MHTKRRKCIVWLMVSLLLITLLPAASLASDRANISLDQAIQSVKQTFAVPPEYTNFSSGYNQGENSQFWSLNWTDPAGKGGNFGAQVDAASGEIISMNSWNPETQAHNRIPSISLADAQNIGGDLLQRLIPSRVSSLVLIPENQLISLTSFGSSNYSVRWQRIFNNIPVMGEGVTMQISASDGQVINYNLNWTNKDMPSPNGIISLETARQSFISEGIIKLEYVMPYPGGSPVIAAQQSPQLVYRLDHPSRGALDAFTGKPVLTANVGWLGGGGGAEEMYSSAKNLAMDRAPQPLTPQEQDEIKNTANLLSQEEAASIVAKWVNIDDNLILRSANLEKNWRDPQQRIWNLSWSSNLSAAHSDIKITAIPISNAAPSSSSSPLPSNLNGRVNARTGELVGFNLDVPAASDSTATMTQETARALADDFLKKVQENHFSQFKFDQVDFDQYKKRIMVPGSNPPNWSFNYLRTVNGILFPNNGVNITVDRISKKIVSYNLNWIDKEFPSPQGALGTDKGNELYLQAAPLTLAYSLFNMVEGSAPEMHLVYLPQNQPTHAMFSMIDAHNGTELNEQGEPLSLNEGSHVFTDIAGNYAEKEISILGQAGLMGEYGNAFHPDEHIKLLALLKAMLNSASGIDNTRNLSEPEIMKRAFELGWIKESLPPDSEVSRGLLAQLMVRSLSLEYLARRTEIFQVPYKDASLLGDDLRGYAALCYGLDIIKGDGTNFDGSHVVTRAEAALALIHSLGAKN